MCVFMKVWKFYQMFSVSVDDHVVFDLYLIDMGFTLIDF